MSASDLVEPLVAWRRFRVVGNTGATGVRRRVASWTGNYGDPCRALTLLEQLLPDLTRVLGPWRPPPHRSGGRSGPVGAVAAQATGTLVESLTIRKLGWAIGRGGPMGDKPVRPRGGAATGLLGGGGFV